MSIEELEEKVHLCTRFTLFNNLLAVYSEQVMQKLISSRSQPPLSEEVEKVAEVHYYNNLDRPSGGATAI